MKTKLLFLLPILALLFAACEKGSENEPNAPKDVEAVDLGLSVKWANMNVGATTPEGYGAYFAWGETTPKELYNWSTYKYCKGRDSTLTKYCAKSEYGYNGFTDGKTTLEQEDDAAHVNWGGSWRMPTKAEQDELREKCTWTWTQKNDINGYEVKGPNGNSIFLPASGIREDSSFLGVGSCGDYWLSSLNRDYPSYAYQLYFDSEVHWSHDNRCYGQSVRPVCK